MKLLNYFCAFILTAAAVVLPAKRLYADDSNPPASDGETHACSPDDNILKAMAQTAYESLKTLKTDYEKYKKLLDQEYTSAQGTCSHLNMLENGALTSDKGFANAEIKGLETAKKYVPDIENYSSLVTQELLDTDLNIAQYIKKNADMINDMETVAGLKDAGFGKTATSPSGKKFISLGSFATHVDALKGVKYFGNTLSAGITAIGSAIQKLSGGDDTKDSEAQLKNAIINNKDLVGIGFDEAKKRKDMYEKCTPVITELENLRRKVKSSREAASKALSVLCQGDCSGSTQCQCDKDNKVIGECVYTGDDVADEDDVSSAGNCKPLNEYQAEFTVCPLCKVFVTLLKACQVLATGSFDQLATPLVEVLTIAFGIYLGLQVLFLVGSPAPGKMSKFLTEVLHQGFKVAFIILLLEGPEYLYGNAVSPVIEGGVDLGFSLMPADAKTILDSSIAEYGSFEENPLLSKNLMERIMSAVKGFNDEAAMIPAIGRALWCNAWEDPILKVLPHTSMLIEGAVIMVFGIMIMLAVGFYLLDCVLQLGVVCCLMPLLLACWPFKITRQYTVVGWNMIVNLFFNFVMVGVVVTAALGLIKQAIAVGDTDLAALVNGNNVQELADSLDILGLQMVMLVASCMIAMKLIKEVASLANKFAPGAGISLGAELGGTVASTATVVAKTAVKAGGGAITKGGGAIAEASGVKGAAQALKGKASNGMKQLAGRFGIGSQAKMVSKGRDTGNQNSETAAGNKDNGQNSNPKENENTNSGERNNNTGGRNNNSGGDNNSGGGNNNSGNGNSNSGGGANNSGRNNNNSGSGNTGGKK